MSDTAGYDALRAVATDPAWLEKVLGGNMEQEFSGDAPGTASADVYRACFSTPAGRAVRQDLYNRFVNVTRCAPGEPEGSSFYREGAAQVVFLIEALMAAGEQEDFQDANES